MATTVEVDTYQPFEKQRAFHEDPAKVRLLRGAFRSGKSRCSIWDMVYMGLRSASRSGAGAIFAMLRKTGPALMDTLLRDFDEAVPRALVIHKLDTPGRVERTLQGGTRFVFRSMDDWKKKGGASYDAALLDEAWEFDEIDFDQIRGRLSGSHGPRRMILCTNPPTRNHWLFQRFVMKPDNGFSEHHFSTYDNAANLPADYITDLEQMDEARKRRFLLGEWGFTSDNQPVFPEFHETSHVANLSFQRVRDAHLLVGWDFGWRHPAVVFSQLLPTGHVQLLRELLGTNVDIHVFAKQVKQLAETYFPGAPMVHYCDVAGRQMHDLGTSSILELLKEDIRPRFRKLSVARTVQQIRDLIRTIHLGVPLLRADRAGCPLLIEALCGGYGMDKDTDEPAKDGFYDHLCLAGDTPIRTLSGWRPISQLVGQEFWTYSYDGHRLVPVRASNVQRTGVQAPVWRVSLDDGTYLRLTPDHPVMRLDGTFAAVRDLRVADRLMPFYEALGRNGHVTLNLNDGSTAYEHRYIYAWFHGPLLPDHHVHHRDEDPMNNDPGNLIQQTRDEHMGAIYARMRKPECRWKTNASTNPWTVQSRAKISVWARAWWASHRVPALCVECGRGFLRVIRQGQPVTGFCSNTCRERRRTRQRTADRRAARLQATNHVVTSSGPDGEADVYSLTVDRYANFPAAGIMVHNCDALRYSVAPAVFFAGEGKAIALPSRARRVAV